MDISEGFEPVWEICYTDDWDMIQAYEEEWNKNHKKKDNELDKPTD